MGDQTNDLNVGLREAYHNHGNLFNVVIVDWSAASKNPNYVDAVQMVPLVGQAVAEFIMALHNVTGQPYDRVGLVGHSLGAHVAGFAGKSVLIASAVGFQSIVGLDPAGPGYTGNQQVHRLSSKDALYVKNNPHQYGSGRYCRTNRWGFVFPELGFETDWLQPRPGRRVQPFTIGGVLC